MAFKDAFAARIESGMRSRGLTLRGLCRAVELDPSFFSKVLAGKRSPPSEEALLRRLAQVLGIAPVELIVAAGRIPAEWEALRDDPELLREVHARAVGRRVPRHPPEPEPPKKYIPPVRGGGHLSEELL